MSDLRPRTIDYRRLAEDELDLVRQIDRTEHIDALYTQHGTRLELRSGDFSASPWRLDGAGEHSVGAQVAAVREYVESGAVALGALDTDRLVRVALVKPNVRPGMAPLGTDKLTASDEQRLFDLLKQQLHCSKIRMHAPDGYGRTLPIPGGVVD